jgi:uncharacterized membrane protein YuzA (DUF378 family)
MPASSCSIQFILSIEGQAVQTTGNNNSSAVYHYPPKASPLIALDWIALILLVVGGINWGLFGTLGIDLLALLFGAMTIPARVMYGLIGLASLYGVVLLMRLARFA